MSFEKYLKPTAAFLVMLLFAIGLGFFRQVNEAERVQFKVDLPQKQEQIVVIDIGQQGLLKYYLQPEVISFYGRGTVKGNFKNLQIKFTGLESFISQGSKKSNWQELQSDEFLQVRKNGRLVINLEGKIPKDKLDFYQVGEAQLQLLSDGQVMSTVYFKIINSKKQQVN